MEIADCELWEGAPVISMMKDSYMDLSQWDIGSMQVAGSRGVCASRYPPPESRDNVGGGRSSTARRPKDTPLRQDPSRAGYALVE